MNSTDTNLTINRKLTCTIREVVVDGKRYYVLGFNGEDDDDK